MFCNEVIVSEKDKQTLVSLLEEAHTIIERYPPFHPEYAGNMTVTTISRAKTFVKDALQWCSYLHTSPDD